MIGDHRILPERCISRCRRARHRLLLFDAYVLPITIAILISLFMIQRHATGSVGKLFGPIMILWFSTLALLGLLNIQHYPQVLQLVNPFWAFEFVAEHQFVSFITLGAVVLTVTGGEALYADMGHFGRAPIRRAWFFV